MEHTPDLNDRLRRLNDIGMALTSRRDLDSLLEKIVTEAMTFASAEGASLYTLEDDCLKLRVTRNRVLEGQDSYRRLRAGDEDQKLERTDESISGFVALNDEVVNIEDAYDIPDSAPYEFDSSFDRKHDYRTRSILGVPMTRRNGEVIGVLLLVNGTSGEEVVPFSDQIIPLVRSLASQAGVAVSNARLTDDLKNAYLETVHRLAHAAEYKDEDTARHIQRMTRFTRFLAEELGCDEDFVENLRYASPLHDVGKIAVPDSVLQKPGPLSEEEYREIQKHTVIGYSLLKDSDSDILQIAAEIALTHHENWDGSGYPRGLSGTDIPVSGRIVCLADAVDAITSRRPYEEPRSWDEAEKEVRTGRGEQFDPNVADAFLENVDAFRDLKQSFEFETTSTGLFSHLSSDLKEFVDTGSVQEG